MAMKMKIQYRRGIYRGKLLEAAKHRMAVTGHWPSALLLCTSD